MLSMYGYNEVYMANRDQTRQPRFTPPKVLHIKLGMFLIPNFGGPNVSMGCGVENSLH